MEEIKVLINGQEVIMWQFVYEAMMRCKGG